MFPQNSYFVNDKSFFRKPAFYRLHKLEHVFTSNFNTFNIDIRKFLTTQDPDPVKKAMITYVHVLEYLCVYLVSV